jgi:glycosyltransferase involved in cell wall biosynthesis
MRIAVIHHNEDLSNDYGAYISTLLDDTAEENGYAIRDYEQLLRFREPLQGENILLHVIIPASGKFSLNRWYNTKLSKIIKKCKLDSVLCSYAIGINSNIPQVLLMPDKELLHANKNMLLWKQYALKHLLKYVPKAKRILTYSTVVKNELKELTALKEQKIFILPYTVSELFKPMEWHDKLYIKSRFSENKEYFIAVLPDDNEKTFTELLKAFSKFKKWQQSNMQLLLLPKEESFSSRVDNKLSSYKYRDDVKLINDSENKETADIIATAYALLHIPFSDADLWPISAALQCGTPVISFHSESIQEYCDKAAILVNERSHEAFGDELIRLFKDETLRNQMSEAAVERAKFYQQKENAVKLWEILTNQA